MDFKSLTAHLSKTLPFWVYHLNITQKWPTKVRLPGFLRFPIPLPDPAENPAGESSFSITAQSSWSISNLRSEIARLRQVVLSSGSELRLLMDTKILKDNELLKNLCATGELELRMLEVPEDFYVRYFAKMVVGGGRDQEFQEFEFCSNGRFRFARNFLQGGFFEGKQLRKECFLSQASLRVLKGLVLKSGILQMDDSQWPAPTRESRQEIEIKCQGIHVVFATKLHWSLPHIDAGRKCAHVREMSEFDELAEEIKGFGKSILNFFGIPRSSLCFVAWVANVWQTTQTIPWQLIQNLCTEAVCFREWLSLGEKPGPCNRRSAEETAMLNGNCNPMTSAGKIRNVLGFQAETWGTWNVHVSNCCFV